MEFSLVTKPVGVPSGVGLVCGWRLGVVGKFLASVVPAT